MYNFLEVNIVIFKRIRDTREDWDYTQKQIAEYLNIKQATYSDYENGKINVPVEAFIKLAELYNVSIDYLTGLSDNK